jgi:hypothetical protein
MKNPQRLLKSGSGVLAGIGLAGIGLVLVGLTAPVMAQTTSNPITDLQNGNTNDLNNVLNGNSGTGAASIMNLMNRLQQMDGRSYEEVSADQRENLNNAADAFRQRQQQRLQAPAAPIQPQPIAPGPGK